MKMLKISKRQVSIFLFFLPLSTMAKGIKSNLAIDQFKNKNFYAVWYENDLPAADSSCIQLTEDDIKKFNKFKCSKSNDSFSDFTCSGSINWKSKTQQIHIMILNKSGKTHCQKKAQSYLDTFS